MIDRQGEIDYAKASAQDLPAIASIHKNSLGVGVLSNCGTSFLVRMYSSIMQLSSNLLVVAKIDGKVVGFIVGMTEKVSPLKSLNLIAVLIFLLNCIRKPYLVISAVTVYRNLSKNQDRPGDVEISHFAVNDRYRGRGVGSRLVSIIGDMARDSGYSSVFTRTHNDRLIEFYRVNFNALEVNRLRTPKVDYVTLKWKIDADRG